MESQKMTQNDFAKFIGMSAGSLSGIFTGRTKPTLNIVEAIKKRIPNINTDWLMFGVGTMFEQAGEEDAGREGGQTYRDSLFNFDEDPEQQNPLPASASAAQPMVETAMQTRNRQIQEQRPVVTNQQREIVRQEVKYVERPQRQITEIRIYFDDLTYETFVPDKGK